MRNIINRFVADQPERYEGGNPLKVSPRLVYEAGARAPSYLPPAQHRGVFTPSAPGVKPQPMLFCPKRLYWPSKAR